MTRTWAEVAADLLDPPPDPLLAMLHPRQRVMEKVANQADLTLAGGSAGPGKTFWLCSHVITQCRTYPRARWVVFRRVMPSIWETVKAEIDKLLVGDLGAGRVFYNANQHTYRFANGSRIMLRSLQYADDVLQFSGVELDGVAFEEMTEFLESQVSFLLGRLRSTVPGSRPHAIGTTNPVGVGLKWVKRWFVRPDPIDMPAGMERVEADTPWRPAATPENPEPLTRAFVPALLRDNPTLMLADPGYINRIRANTDRRMVKALEEGDWDAMTERPGALWTLAVLDEHRVREAPETMTRVVTGVDPPGGRTECGIVSAGVATLHGVRHFYVLADRSIAAAPDQWARTVKQAHEAVEGDLVVAEKNFGGDMVLSTLKAVDPDLPVKLVTASRGKAVRAEPVAQLSIEGRLHIVGFLPELEAELTDWVPGDPDSPNRLDGMTWSCTELMETDDAPVVAPGHGGQTSGWR